MSWKFQFLRVNDCHRPSLKFLRQLDSTEMILFCWWAILYHTISCRYFMYMNKVILASTLEINIFACSSVYTL